MDYRTHKYNNHVIEVLDREHGAKVIKWWESQGVENDGLTGSCTKLDNNKQRYYGLIDGVFDNYTMQDVEPAIDEEVKIIELPEKATQKQAIATPITLPPKTIVHVTTVEEATEVTRLLGIRWAYGDKTCNRMIDEYGSRMCCISPSTRSYGPRDSYDKSYTMISYDYFMDNYVESKTYMSYQVKPEDLIGNLRGFPIEVVQVMVNYSFKQGGFKDIKKFQANSSTGDFTWADTPDGNEFWRNVIDGRDFALFYTRYPKKEHTQKYEDMDRVDATLEAIKPYVVTKITIGESNKPLTNKNKNNGNTIKVQRVTPTVTSGSRRAATIIRGRGSVAAVTVRRVSHQTIIGR